jgi:ferrous-iron efflux pump FieF
MSIPPDQKGLRWLLAASYASVAVAFLLIAAKLVAWYLTDSASMLGSLLDSVMDSMASLINMVAVRYSIKPADEDHRFGHGKAESLAGLAQSGFIMASAFLLLVHCAERLAGPSPAALENVTIGLAVTVFALCSTLALVAVQSHAIRLTGSTAIRADSLHYKSDILLNLSVMAALAGASWGFPRVDAILGAGIAFFIAHGAWRIGWEAFDMLMDRELPPEVDREILALALSHGEVLGVHDLRTRRSGNRYHIQLHLEFADDTVLLSAHNVADEVEAAIGARFPGADIIIHQDPQGIVASERATSGAASSAGD